jgi:hypothetical protein
MLNRLLAALVAFIAVTTIGCAGTKSPSYGSEWGEDPQPPCFASAGSDPSVLVGKGQALSRDPQFAMETASDQARVALAAQISANVERLFRAFREEVGSEDPELLRHISSVSQVVVSETLVGARLTCDKTLVNAETNQYRAFAVVELPAAEASAGLLNRMQRENELYNRYRSTEAYKAMREEVDRYNEAREKSGF